MGILSQHVQGYRPPARAVWLERLQGSRHSGLLFGNCSMCCFHYRRARRKEHSNKPLVSITDGKKLGEIKGLYLDLEMRQVAGVYLGTEGLIKRKVLAIPRSAVQVPGIDVWLVSGPETVMALQDIADSATFTLVSDLRGREIQTEGGTKLAVVEDVLLDGETRVLGFTLGKVYAEGPLNARKNIAREAITDLGSEDKPMTALLAQAESLAIPSV